MFDRATCMAMRVTSEPVVEFAALAALQELLATATAHGEIVPSSNTPVSSPASEARNQDRGKDDATTSPSSAVRAVLRTDGDNRGLSGFGLARTAGSDATSADGIDVAAPARPLLPQPSPIVDGGG